MRLPLRWPTRRIHLPRATRTPLMRRFALATIIGVCMGVALWLAARTTLGGFAAIFVMAVCILVMPEAEERNDILAPWRDPRRPQQPDQESDAQ